MKNYEKPDAVVTPEWSEGVFAASGAGAGGDLVLNGPTEEGRWDADNKAQYQYTVTYSGDYKGKAATLTVTATQTLESIWGGSGNWTINGTTAVRETSVFDESGFAITYQAPIGTKLTSASLELK